MSGFFKSTFLILFFLISLDSGLAQTGKGPVKIPEFSISRNSQRIFEEALKDVVFCMRQEYVIKNRKGEKFGHLGNEYFGKSLTIGVLVDADIWFPTYLRKPWRDDPNFMEFKNSHQAECSNLFIKTVRGDLERELTRLDIDTSYALSYIKQGKGGLKIWQGQEKNVGYLMLFHIPNNDNNKFPAIDMTMHQLDQVDWDLDGTAPVKNFTYIGKESIGGLYLVEEISTGKIELKIAGMYIKSGDEWILNALPPQKKNEL
ncbi:MAG: hypothetical protein ACNS62_21535 [Candidatus Cyclobacteriaceae bacterium M3_2C_046]